VAALLPGVELLRLDSDVASSLQRLTSVLDRFGAPGPRVLVGTQMVAKGHHFPDVTLVGVVNADLALYFPDYRSEERTFAMLLQVGGRSGRGERPGRVIVQTYDPEARPIALAADAATDRFYAEELERRTLLRYPPASTLIALETSSPDAQKAAGGGRRLAEELRRALRTGEDVLGPGPLWRERSRFYCRSVVKTAQVGETIQVLRPLVAAQEQRLAAAGVRLVVDVEPSRL
jgi:primosomal protein N' (replication factor Y) (superfamily II helicase)